MRAFVALELPAGFSREVSELSRQLAATCSGRFVPEGNHHLTLAFLGELCEAEVRAAMAALDEVSANAGPVSLAVDGLGTFGGGANRTLWLGIRLTDELGSLAERLRRALADRGLSFDEKPFLPHVTLARRVRLPRGELGDLVFPTSDEARCVTLFRSILSSVGASYKPLYSVEL